MSMPPPRFWPRFLILHRLQLQHLRKYAEDALVLEAGSRSGMPQAAPKGGPGDGREAFLLAVAPDASCKEVGGAYLICFGCGCFKRSVVLLSSLRMF